VLAMDGACAQRAARGVVFPSTFLSVGAPTTCVQARVHRERAILCTHRHGLQQQPRARAGVWFLAAHVHARLARGHDPLPNRGPWATVLRLDLCQRTQDVQPVPGDQDAGGGWQMHGVQACSHAQIASTAPGAQRAHDCMLTPRRACVPSCPPTQDPKPSVAALIPGPAGGAGESLAQRLGEHAACASLVGSCAVWRAAHLLPCKSNS
jgi:hypothetical protein